MSAISTVTSGRDPFSSSVRICRSTHVDYRQSAWMHKATLYLLRIKPSDSHRISITFTGAVFPQSFSARLKCTSGLYPWSYLRRNLHTSNPFSPATNKNVPDASEKSETHSVMSLPGVRCEAC